MERSSLIESLERWEIAVPITHSEYDCACDLIQAAISKKRPLSFVLGTYFNDEMEEKPWRALMWPTAFQESSQGLRIKCEVEHLGEAPMISSAEQSSGSRLILISKIEDLGLAE